MPAARTSARDGDQHAEGAARKPRDPGRTSLAGGSAGIRLARLVGEERYDIDVVEVDKHAPSLGLAPHQERR
jgi:hypothetical protein